MKTTGTIVLLFGAIVTLGGLVGYVKAESLISLAVATPTGLILIIAGFSMLREKRSGFICALTLTLLMTAFFSYRFFTTLKVMPAGLMLVMSLLTLMSLIVYIQSKRRPR